MFIVFCLAVAFYCLGNVMGWTSAQRTIHKNIKKKRETELYKQQQSFFEQDEECFRTSNKNYNEKISKEELIDNLLKFSLEYDPKTHSYYKVEEVEVEIVDEYDNVLPFPK